MNSLIGFKKVEMENQMTKTTFNYQKLKNHRNIFKNQKTGHYLVRKKINSRELKKSFESLEEAILWRDQGKIINFDKKTSA